MIGNMTWLIDRKASFEHAIGKSRAAVTIRVKNRNELVVADDGICILKADALISKLPDGVRIYDPNGKEVTPTGSFYITTESFDPFHIVTDIF